MCFLLIDHHNILYRAYYSQLSTHELRPWGPVIRYLDMLRACVQKTKYRYRKTETIKFIFAAESLTVLKRTLQNPDYKANRGPRNNDDVFNSLLSAMGFIALRLNIPMVRLDGFEADDVIASLVQNLSGKRIIFSNDRDLRQLLSHTNTVIYQNPGLFYTPDMFKEDYGFTPDKFVFYKALVGDKSDNLSGVEGWGPVKAKKHILAGSWLNQLDEEKNKDVYWKSMELVRLFYDPELSVDGHELVLEGGQLDKLNEEIKGLYSSNKAVKEINLSILRLAEVA